ncbi:hypothetical protein LDVICp105 [lymphocystis disease virus-China]|uniref:Uncharacterized protein n=1 Tax=lymphocystis disease virus-China TaxID=256729 RepID=Q678A7_9VIRU|nr:hypothetical protein LDVICp105 [lymphocystis disease virus-China]AAU10950.1 hypothetical protein [lymphocystis disease virus-China]
MRILVLQTIKSEVNIFNYINMIHFYNDLILTLKTSSTICRFRVLTL